MSRTPICKRAAAFAAALLLTGWVVAQPPLVPSNHAVGWADLPLPLGVIDIQDIDNGCKPAVTVCNTLPVPVAAVNPFAGGTAYDPRYQSVWISDGVALFEFGLPKCLVRCQSPAFRVNPQSVISGLAIADRTRQLWQLETLPGFMAISVYNNLICPPAPMGGCPLPLPPGALAGGLAYDEVNSLLYVSVSLPVGGGWNNFLWVFPANLACQPLCQVPIFNCLPTFVTGLGYDACTQILYATDGTTTQSIRVVAPAQCGIVLGPCCKKQLNSVWRGLCVIPGWAFLPVGQSCTAAPCPACPGMSAATAGGDPSLGNQSFQVTLAGAPANQPALFILGGGACTPGFFFVCGSVHPSWAPPPMLLGPFAAAGPAPCGGAIGLTLPIPAVAGLCGQMFCAQWLVICPVGAGFGFGLSNAVQFNVTGS